MHATVTALEDCPEGYGLGNDNDCASQLSSFSTLVVVVEKALGKPIKSYLETAGLYDKERKVQHRQSDEKLLLPVVTCTREVLVKGLVSTGLASLDISLDVIDVPASRCLYSSKPPQPFEALTSLVVCHIAATASSVNLLSELPVRWEKHGDIVLFPSGSFSSDFWRHQDSTFWASVAGVFRARRVGLMGAILSDSYRTPRVELLLGASGWTQHIDNGVVYCFDVTKCMFSSGNITEKLRVAKLACAGETVVDLFAGIGYFTLPFLVHAGAALVHACEWNPHAIEALRRGLIANSVSSERCIIHEGDNKEVCPCEVADRVNLGLLPTSRGAWPVACRALKSSGGILHIHENVDYRAQSDSPRLSCIINERLVAAAAAPESASKTTESNRLEAAAGSERATEAAILKRLAAAAMSDTSSTAAESKGLAAAARLAATEDFTRCVTENGLSAHPEKQHFAEHAMATANIIRDILEAVRGGLWGTCVTGIHRVKSYAPHVSHLVFDIKCWPARAAAVK